MKSTFSRIFFPAALILLAALLVVGTAFQALVKNYIQQQAMDGLKNDGAVIAQIAAAYHADSSFDSRDFLVNLTVAASASGADAAICDTSGKLLLCSHAPLGCSHQGLILRDRQFLQQALTQDYTESTGRVQGLYTEARYVVATPIRDTVSGDAVGFVLVSTPMAQTVAVLQRLSDIYLFVSLLVIVLAVVVVTIYARSHSAPLREMARVARDFGHGDLSARVSPAKDGPLEVQALTLAFNNMADSLEKSEDRRKEFVANISHELKTPMTTIGGYVDGMLDGTIPPEKHRHYMTLVSEETKRLSRLVRSMLDISRLQSQGGIPEEMKSRFDLSECLGRVLISFEQKIAQKNLQVSVRFPEHPVFTLACQDHITQVVYNLVDNAVKFCPPEGDLGLGLHMGTDKLYVTVSNPGPTIPPEELPLVFDRFHKLDKSRSQNRDGWGLGLYIVKTIVCSHGEDISVTSQNGRTEFTFTLPQVN